eukprot:TRINITY_DN8077_c0_g2_i1.p1 TRINITY_DN8077_c0_g2~~TRINITY_DN8077_c0_g2_i1.p1  ORF type:complete len:1422 (+),score=492.51 TRINITY_DN8077_c0_g2_i1:82-4266(+)
MAGSAGSFHTSADTRSFAPGSPLSGALVARMGSVSFYPHRGATAASGGSVAFSPRRGEAAALLSGSIATAGSYGALGGSFCPELRTMEEIVRYALEHWQSGAFLLDEYERKRDEWLRLREWLPERHRDAAGQWFWPREHHDDWRLRIAAPRGARLAEERYAAGAGPGAEGAGRRMRELAEGRVGPFRAAEVSAEMELLAKRYGVPLPPGLSPQQRRMREVVAEALADWRVLEWRQYSALRDEWLGLRQQLAQEQCGADGDWFRAGEYLWDWQLRIAAPRGERLAQQKCAGAALSPEAAERRLRELEEGEIGPHRALEVSAEIALLRQRCGLPPSGAPSPEERRMGEIVQAALGSWQDMVRHRDPGQEGVLCFRELRDEWLQLRLRAAQGGGRTAASEPEWFVAHEKYPEWQLRIADARAPRVVAERYAGVELSAEAAAARVAELQGRAVGRLGAAELGAELRLLRERYGAGASGAPSPQQRRMGEIVEQALTSWLSLGEVEYRQLRCEWLQLRGELAPPERSAAGDWFRGDDPQFGVYLWRARVARPRGRWLAERRYAGAALSPEAAGRRLRELEQREIGPHGLPEVAAETELLQRRFGAVPTLSPVRRRMAEVLRSTLDGWLVLSAEEYEGRRDEWLQLEERLPRRCGVIDPEEVGWFRDDEPLDDWRARIAPRRGALRATERHDGAPLTPAAAARRLRELCAGEQSAPWEWSEHQAEWELLQGRYEAPAEGMTEPWAVRMSRVQQETARWHELEEAEWASLRAEWGLLRQRLPCRARCVSCCADGPFDAETFADWRRRCGLQHCAAKYEGAALTSDEARWRMMLLENPARKEDFVLMKWEWLYLRQRCTERVPDTFRPREDYAAWEKRMGDALTLSLMERQATATLEEISFSPRAATRRIKDITPPSDESYYYASSYEWLLLRDLYGGRPADSDLFRWGEDYGDWRQRMSLRRPLAVLTLACVAVTFLSVLLAEALRHPPPAAVSPSAAPAEVPPQSAGALVRAPAALCAARGYAPQPLYAAGLQCTLVGAALSLLSVLPSPYGGGDPMHPGILALAVAAWVSLSGLCEVLRLICAADTPAAVAGGSAWERYEARFWAAAHCPRLPVTAAVLLHTWAGWYLTVIKGRVQIDTDHRDSAGRFITARMGKLQRWRKCAAAAVLVTSAVAVAVVAAPLFVTHVLPQLVLLPCGLWLNLSSRAFWLAAALALAALTLPPLLAAAPAVGLTHCAYGYLRRPRFGGRELQGAKVAVGAAAAALAAALMAAVQDLTAAGVLYYSGAGAGDALLLPLGARQTCAWLQCTARQGRKGLLTAVTDWVTLSTAADAAVWLAPVSCPAADGAAAHPANTQACLAAVLIALIAAAGSLPAARTAFSSLAVIRRIYDGDHRWAQPM